MPLLAALLLWVLFWYRETALSMASLWARSDTFAHGFVVPVVAGWLIWRQRRQLAGLAPQPSPWMLLPLAAAGFAWLLGELSATHVLAQFALTAVLVLSAAAVLGRRIARLLAFPLAFLFFMVPAGEFVMPQLMAWTADFTVLGLRLSGVPVYRDGLQFVIPSGSWSVVEACSGVRYLIASLMVGTLFAYLNYASAKRRLIFVAVAAAVPIVANWLRAYLTVMLGHLSDNRLAAGVDHLVYGWLFFGVVVMVMFAIGRRWSEPVPLTAAAVSGEGGAGKPSGVPLAMAAVALLACLPPLAHAWIGSRDAALAAPRLSLPAAAGLAGWTAGERLPLAWQPAFANPSAATGEVYGRDGRRVGLYLAYYRNQGYDRKLIGSGNKLVDGNDAVWAQVAHGRQETGLGGGPAAVRSATLRTRLGYAGKGETLVVWHWYWIGGRLTASEPLAKIHTVLSRLLGQGDDAAAVVLYAPAGQPGGAEAALGEFAAANWQAVEAALQAARNER